jgi:hypothetical protein
VVNVQSDGYANYPKLIITQCIHAPNHLINTWALCAIQKIKLALLW